MARTRGLVLYPVSVAVVAVTCLTAASYGEGQVGGDGPPITVARSESDLERIAQLMLENERAWRSDAETRAGLLRTVQRINNPAAERVRPWWAEAALNALGGFLAGWLSYLTLAHTLPAPVVVLTVAACAYTPVLLIEKFNDFMRSKN